MAENDRYRDGERSAAQVQAGDAEWPSGVGAGRIDQASLYRLSWEMVDQRELWRYCNADPNYYKNTTQTVPNSQIPDEHWHPLSKMTDNPWQQFNTLRQWASEDREFVRNVRLEAMSITYTEATTDGD